MKHHQIRGRAEFCLRLLAVCLLCAGVSGTLLLTASAEEAALWGAVPIAETQASEPVTQPHNSTSVGNLSMPNRETAPAVSYGLRILAAREELVFTGLCGSELSFTAEDICRAMNRSEVNYITIRSLPATGEGTLFVGSVGAAEGQVISAGSLPLLSFAPADDASPSEASMTISVDGSDYTLTCRLCFLDHLNYTPTVSLAPTLSLKPETYRDLAVSGTMSAYDPEGDEITYEIVRYASHGRVSLTDRHTGAYIYTPDAGFTGQDSFDYVVYDRYGNYSTSATVSVTVTSPPATVTYSDLEDSSSRGDTAAILAVSAMGLMNGTQVGNECYFKPDEAISRAEFLVTAMQAAGITATEAAKAELPNLGDLSDIPTAMRPFVGYAVQKKYIGGKTVDGQLCFCPNDSITRAEAAVILSNIIGYAVEDTVTAFADAETLPAWSEEALTSLRALGILSSPDGHAHPGKTMTRAKTAVWLKRAVDLMGS